MTVDVNTVVSLSYKLTNHLTGEAIEETLADRPMQFLYGIERVIPAFEEAIHGLKSGEPFTVSIAAGNAYGTRGEEKIVRIPITVFHDESGQLNTEHIFEGALLPMTDGEGNHLRGTVVKIDTEEITMDFNHPLAGIDLHFSGEILDVRAATDDEISHGHSHGEHGHQH